MADRRVAVTGLGVVTAGGIGAEEFWQSLREGRKCIRRIQRFDPVNFPCHVAGQIEDFSAHKFVPKNYRKSVKVMSRDIEIAVAASDLAFKDAQITTRAANDQEMSIDSHRLGCNIGAGLICCDLDELGMAAITSVTDGKFDIRSWGQGGMNNLTPLWLLKYLPNMLSCHVTIIHGAEGPSNCITCGAASGLLSAAEGGRWIRRNEADAVIAGGAEAKLIPLGLLRQSLLNRLCRNGNDDPPSACRPFDARHSGTVMGEGGGLLILEDMDRAQGRGANIYAELVGFGAACDPDGINVTNATAGGMDLAAKKALADAGILPQDIDMIAAHGTGVAEEDRCEAIAWGATFGQRVQNIPAAAFTGGIGSLFAGQSGATLVATALALHKQTVPPTANFETPFDGCTLNLASEPREVHIRYAIVGAFSVGGLSAACILKRYEP